MSLRRDIKYLKEENLRLKNYLLAHNNCNCNIIKEYVKSSFKE